MGESDDRPVPNDCAPDLSKPREVLEALLSIEWQRLEVAQRIEKERAIVFPETTVIIRDIQKLMSVLGRDVKGLEIGAPKPAKPVKEKLPVALTPFEELAEAVEDE